ncbi:transposase [Bacillus pseudomycoides]|uniref:hypothetical protein n=1 Tax=Bacillus pseudomycoides TaxID=64104 RepID=UPI0001A135E4|nr:hypothetical protein [Bacillus pseudomycoides]EEM02830.1 Transposase [Bacillus pseudomycoides]EEM08213.1 Transposase [Bacillus pseudomycoides]KFN16106.1 hypothetical protein DJ94_5619 [Bacillus pseudomycoides]MBD5799820.1 transposase [Bacillus pseudomycoides]
MDIVYQTLDKLKDRLGDMIHPEALLHSDFSLHAPGISALCKGNGYETVYVT